MRRLSNWGSGCLGVSEEVADATLHVAASASASVDEALFAIPAEDEDDARTGSSGDEGLDEAFTQAMRTDARAIANPVSHNRIRSACDGDHDDVDQALGPRQWRPARWHVTMLLQMRGFSDLPESDDDVLPYMQRFASECFGLPWLSSATIRSHRLERSFDGSVLHDGDFVYSLSLQQTVRLDYFHGSHGMFAAACLYDDERDVVDVSCLSLLAMFKLARMVRVARRAVLRRSSIRYGRSMLSVALSLARIRMKQPSTVVAAISDSARTPLSATASFQPTSMSAPLPVSPKILMQVSLMMHSPLKYSPLCFVDRRSWHSHPRVNNRVRRSEELLALCVLSVCRCPLELKKVNLFGSESLDCDTLGVDHGLRRHCEAFVAGALHGLEFDVMPESLCEHGELGMTRAPVPSTSRACFLLCPQAAPKRKYCTWCNELTEMSCEWCGRPVCRRHRGFAPAQFVICRECDLPLWTLDSFARADAWPGV